MAYTGEIRLAVDIGGTFTDAALEVSEQQYTAKTLTTHDSPERGIITVFQQALEAASLSPQDVSLIIYGTTLATNLLIERKGAPMALLTTEGFRDSIEIRNESRYDQYDLSIDLPKPLVSRALRFPVSERMNAHGNILLPLDEKGIESLVPTLMSEEVQSIAVGYLHSYANGVHEQRTREILLANLPNVEITLSSEVSPELREYERISTACANAYVLPLMSLHLRNLEKVLKEADFQCPLFLMLSGGGITTMETALRYPIRLVESGPSGGAIFASHIARELRLSDVVSYDMGGTTAKICMIDDFEPQTARTFEVARVYRFMKGSGIPLRIPVIEMVEIGAGGGSLAHVDTMGRIAVGPHSSGSDPGPACYGLGGNKPAVTDADVVLGRIDPNNFAGGTMQLNRDNAVQALKREVGDPLNLNDTLSALGVSEMVDENMANAARMHAIESGKEIEARTLIAFGGAAPLHAVRMAEKLKIDQVVIPPGAGVGSAIGFLRAPVAYEVIRSLYQRLSSIDTSEGKPLVETRTAYMRYVGQGHEVGVEIPVQVTDKMLGEDAAQKLMEGFEREYLRLYERSIPNLDVEVLTWVLLVSTERDLLYKPAEEPEVYEPQVMGKRVLMDTETGQFITAKVYDRTILKPGAQMQGPAVLLEKDTATVVSVRFQATVHSFGYIILTRREEE
ncbi:MAG TPA: hydantoinase/oxoprolinase family protein [Candidatus Marinimicrobia bacterium]|nr:hydantoinase/oxoprolinase family protein [Candidatus Neomarinimicrobiota bacterium]